MANGGPPRLVVTDALGRRIVPIDKALFTIGRRTETDLRLAGADISRVHAEIVTENSNCTIRDRAARSGTFVNGGGHDERRIHQVVSNLTVRAAIGDSLARCAAE